MHLIKFILILVATSLCINANAATITTITVKEMDGVSTANYPLTFGHVFQEGDVTGSVYLDSYATQTDVKTTWPDGSIRHAVISAIVPMTANADLILNINDTGTAAGTTPITKTEMLATDIGATIDLSSISDSGYSGSLQADLRSTINAASSFDYWLEGGVVSEILIDQRLNNSINATWEVRFYPGTSFIRVSHTMENVEANYRGNIDYTVSISHGNAYPAVLYGPKTITHLKNSRWRKVFWLGTAPPEIEMHYDLDYLISTGHIMPYDTSIALDSTAVSDDITSWNSRNTDLYESTLSGGSYLAGFANMNFPATGGRPEIGVLPKWTVKYLLSWDAELKEIMLRQAEILAFTPSHWREYDPTKSFNGRIINIDDRPKVRIRNETDAVSSDYDPLPEAIGTTDNPWSIDLSHQGSFNYIPYLITGEYFYLQEMYYWAGFNLAEGNWNADWGRNLSEGIVRSQIRGVAWGLRNIIDAAVMAPNGTPEKTYFESKVQNNIVERTATRSAYPLRYTSDNDGAPSGQVASVTNTTSGWMEDFFTLVMVHAGRMGYSTNDLLIENSKFVIGRFSNPDFNWYLGAEYRFPTTTTSGTVQTWAEASSLYSANPTSFSPIGYAYSYRHISLANLSQLTSYTGGQDAYDWLLANFTAVEPSFNEQYAIDPTWAILPGDVATPEPAGDKTMWGFNGSPVNWINP